MRKRIAASAVLLAVFAICAVFAATGCLERYELILSEAISRTEVSNAVMKYFTDIGEFSGVCSAIILLLIIPAAQKRIALPATVTVLSSLTAQLIVKPMIARERPIERLLQITGYSFPSGHTINSTALYISVMLLGMPLCKCRAQRLLLSAACIIIPLMIGISRIYFNVHYLTDVIGGWSLGAALSLIGSTVYSHFTECKNGKAEK